MASPSTGNDALQRVIQVVVDNFDIGIVTKILEKIKNDSSAVEILDSLIGKYRHEHFRAYALSLVNEVITQR